MRLTGLYIRAAHGFSCSGSYELKRQVTCTLPTPTPSDGTGATFNGAESGGSQSTPVGSSSETPPGKYVEGPTLPLGGECSLIGADLFPQCSPLVLCPPWIHPWGELGFATILLSHIGNRPGGRTASPAPFLPGKVKTQHFLVRAARPCGVELSPKWSDFLISGLVSTMFQVPQPLLPWRHSSHRLCVSLLLTAVPPSLHPLLRITHNHLETSGHTYRLSVGYVIPLEESAGCHGFGQAVILSHQIISSSLDGTAVP